MSFTSRDNEGCAATRRNEASASERRGSLGHLAERERGECCHAVSHVVGGLVLPRRERNRIAGTRRHQQVEAGVAQGPPSGTLGIRAVRTAVGERMVALGERRREL